jgi:hypothetical protein
MDAGSTTFTIGVPFVIQTGTFGIGHSGDLVATVPFSFMEDITINGITEDVTVTGQDLVAIEVETIEFNALGPISFGSESLSIEAYSIGSPTLRELPVELTATVSGPSPVPEPSSIALFGSGALGLVGIIRRRVMV